MVRLTALCLITVLALSASVGCATHTEIGGPRVGVTANWQDPGMASQYAP